MKKSVLIKLLCSSDEDEVFLQDEEGVLYDIDVEHVEETFDGFYTVYPASLALKKRG